MGGWVRQGDKGCQEFVSTELYTSVKQSTTAKAVIITHRVLGVMFHNLASSVGPCYYYAAT